MKTSTVQTVCDAMNRIAPKYLADASSVEITRNKDGLISALQKLENQSTSMEVNKATESLYIINPLKNKEK